VSKRKAGQAAPITALALLAPVIAAGIAPGIAPGIAHAQVPGALQGAPFGVPQGSPIPRVLPATPPSLSPGAPLTAEPAAQPMPAASLAIAAVRVEGASAYAAAELERLVAGLAGPAVPLARIEEARLALLRRYREDGYVLTAVSAEVGRDGLLRFIVAEGRIAEVRLDGDIGPAATQVLMFLERLVTIGPLDQALLERQLLLAQEVPGVSVRAVLRPIPGAEPGTLQLVAQVSRTPYSALLAADNRGFRLVGPEQGVAGLSLNSFTQYGERTDIVLFNAVGGTQTFGQVAMEAFIGGSGLRWRAYAGRGEANPSGNLRAIGYESTTTQFGIGLAYPLIRRRNQVLTVSGGLDALETEIRIGTGAEGETRASYDSLRVLRLGAEWARQDLLAGEARPAVNTANLRLSQGLTALGASSNGAALPGRVGQDMDFFKINGEATRSQALFSPWEGATIGLFGLIAGQWTNDVLPSVEKFYLGGLRLNRGYYAGEVTGDRALSTSVELRLDDGYRVPAFGRSLDVAAQYYAFYDWGQSFENQNDQPDRVLRSAGAGVRLVVERQTELQLEGVTRMNRRPQGDQVDALSSQAVYWRVLTRF
jgi:hemolysin activation/secretion protein